MTLPQQPTASDAVVESIEWLFEPAWKGERLMARLRDGHVTLTDAHGQPAPVEMDEAARLLSQVLDANDALIDGIWTSMPFVDEAPGQIAAEPRQTFVAVDMVEVDGQPLHDVPYVERRRLLDSVVQESFRVRVSPAVRLPLEPWLAGWRERGFEHYLAKHVNSRYRPGEVSRQWLKIPTAKQPEPSLIRQLLGSRPKKVPHIADDPDPGVRRQPRP
jgi:bifunctional non-homologous end joining protein LigD